MTNHPNRSWRRLMHESAGRWLASPEGYPSILGPPAVLSPDDLREIMRLAYLAGYQAGRESRAPKPRTDP